jgi:hypothetical protein
LGLQKVLMRQKDPVVHRRPGFIDDMRGLLLRFAGR